MVSASTNVLGVLDNVNDLIPLNLMSSFGLMYSWANLMSFHSVTLLLRSLFQLVGAVGSWMIFNQGQSTIPQSKLIITEAFLFVYVIQRFAKAFLFLAKTFGTSSQLVDRLVFGFSTIFNLVQMLSTVLS